MGVKHGLKMTHDLKIQQTCMIFMLMIQHWEIFALDKKRDFTNSRRDHAQCKINMKCPNSH